jgi:hypothetical protein
MSAVVIIITVPPPPPPPNQQQRVSAGADQWAQQIASAVRGALQGLDVRVLPEPGCLTSATLETKPAPDRL